MAKTRSSSTQAPQTRQQAAGQTAQAPATATSQPVNQPERVVPAVEQVQRSAPASDQATQEQLQTAPETGISTPIVYPNWPTSRPGPRATPPPLGSTPINAFRPEQVAELGYNQETGEPENESLGEGLSDADQPRTAQEEIGKRRIRL